MKKSNTGKKVEIGPHNIRAQHQCQAGFPHASCDRPRQNTRADISGSAPICDLLDWSGEEIPNTLKSLGIRESFGVRPITQFLIERIRAKERPDSRLQDLHVDLKPSQKPGGFRVLLWRRFDETLKEEFGFE